MIIRSKTKNHINYESLECRTNPEMCAKVTTKPEEVAVESEDNVLAKHLDPSAPNLTPTNKASHPTKCLHLY